MQDAKREAAHYGGQQKTSAGAQVSKT